MDDAKADEVVRKFVETVEKYGTVHRHHHYRPMSECCWAGFFYTLGAILAFSSVWLSASAVKWLWAWF